RRALLPALLVVVLGVSAGSPARGQQPPQPAYPPYSAYPSVTQPTQQSGVVARPTAPPAGYAPPPVNVNQYAPGNSNPYSSQPYYNTGLGGGQLTGAANAINAQGEYEKQFQQARL